MLTQGLYSGVRQRFANLTKFPSRVSGYTFGIVSTQKAAFIHDSSTKSPRRDILLVPLKQLIWMHQHLLPFHLRIIVHFWQSATLFHMDLSHEAKANTGESGQGNNYQGILSTIVATSIHQEWSPKVNAKIKVELFPLSFPENGREWRQRHSQWIEWS